MAVEEVVDRKVYEPTDLVPSLLCEGITQHSLGTKIHILGE
jgi:hypothetical protein